jgi:hypothetical protein
MFFVRSSKLGLGCNECRILSVRLLAATFICGGSSLSEIANSVELRSGCPTDLSEHALTLTLASCVENDLI